MRGSQISPYNKVDPLKQQQMSIFLSPYIEKKKGVDDDDDNNNGGSGNHDDQQDEGHFPISDFGCMELELERCQGGS